MKMDAVPGTPTTMWFTPTKTTKEMIAETGNPKFVFEISCDQMCGSGHTGMRGEIVVETQEEFDAWLAGKTPHYQSTLPTTPAAPARADSTSVTTVRDTTIAQLKTK
jgi:cytochrome c oxidase subunit 2